jgi:hypothetical protein
LQKSSECPDTKERFAKLSAGEILIPVRAPVEFIIAGTSPLQQFCKAIECLANAAMSCAIPVSLKPVQNEV